MNCQSCNTTIDYKFLSNCLKCGAEVRPETGPQTVEIPKDVPLAPQQKSVSWGRSVANVVCVLLSSLVGMVSGAVVVYCTAVVFFAMLPSNPGENPSASCARGMAIGMLSILTGAFLGTAGGSALATKHFVVKH